ncbi:hypothetical protein E9993_13745 [Labilibacter sediminis]|nr:hypothetical protein E9993_13745 [Labilibacter sediminis]
MSSAGHVLDMIKRSKYNASIRQKRIDRIAKLKDIYQQELINKNHQKFHRKKIAPEELKEIKARIRQRLAYKRKIAFVSTIVATILVMGLCALLLYLWGLYLEGS